MGFRGAFCRCSSGATRTKRSFEDKCVPKLELGYER
jgi:hypothetical protein